MKRTLFLLLIVVTALTACKKDPQEKLEGRWNQMKVHLVQTNNGTKTEDDIPYEIGKTYIVFGSNTYKYYQDGEVISSGPFTATENSITLTMGEDKNTYVLRWNSKKEMIIVFELNDRTNPNFSAKAEATFRKH